MKRNIGHLCHDEHREAFNKRSRSDPDHTGTEEAVSPKNVYSAPPDMLGVPLRDTSTGPSLQETNAELRPAVAEEPSIATQLSRGSVQALTESTQSCEFSWKGSWSATNNPEVLGNDDQWLGSQNRFQDMHNFHPSYMFNAPEVTNEYNLLNDFLNTSLLDENGTYLGQEFQGFYSDPSLINEMASSLGVGAGPALHNFQQNTTTSLSLNNASQGTAISRPPSTMPLDKARETYYMTAADPSGADPPEERMNKLLKAKYDAGMLKPFNYVKGYARLNQYMEKHMQPVSRQKILRTLEKFRPKFRERMHSLTDIELVLVEMWFERSLMEYDRVFASMAIPACCWRRTGEIFRGNKEMAELIHVPIESLRDVRVKTLFLLVVKHLTPMLGQACYPRNHCGRSAG